jgi:hypothetical protein
MKKLDRLDLQTLSANPRASLSSWRKYEPIVEAAFFQHPKPYIYAPSSLSPYTVSSRIREAIRGKLAFDYPAKISTLDLSRWYDEIIIKNDAKNVFIGPPEEVQKSIKGTSLSTSPTYSFDSLSFEEISAFSLLLSNGRLTGPVTILQPPDISLLPDRPNVERIEKDGGLMLI